MKKIAIALVLVSAAAFGWSLTSPVAKADGAIHIDGAGCGLLDGNGGFVITDNSKAIITPSGNGMLRCQADVTPSSTGHAVRYDNANTGGLCGTPAGVTDQWGETVSANGNATLSCHVN